MWLWCVNRSSNAIVSFASPEHRGPLGEIQVRRAHHSRVLIQIAQQVEQQRTARLAERAGMQWKNRHVRPVKLTPKQKGDMAHKLIFLAPE